MRKFMIQVLTCLIIVVLLGWGGQAVASSAAEDDKVLVPDFTLLTQTNETFNLGDYRGEVVVLNFWASWCPPCKSEMPEFQELHEELSESGEALLFLLNQIDGRQETVEKGAKFLSDNGFTMNNLLDFGTVGAKIFGLPGLPTTVVIDRDGYLSGYVVGATTKETILQMIEAAK